MVVQRKRSMVRVRRKNMQSLWLIAIFLFLMASCARPPEPPVIEEPEIVEEPVVEEEVPTLQPVTWQQVPGWQEDDPSQALAAFRNSCSALRWRP